MPIKVTCWSRSTRQLAGPSDRPKAKGEIDIPQERAHEYGQNSGFRINVKRVAALPLTSEFFPDLEMPNHGICGSSEHLAKAAERILADIVRETPELIQTYGPPDAQEAVFGWKK